MKASKMGLGWLIALLVLGPTAGCGGGLPSGRLSPQAPPTPTPTPLPQVTLRLQLQPGATYPMRMTADQHIVQNAMGTTVELDQRVGMGMSFEIREVDASGNFWADITYDAISYRMSMPAMGMTMEYDSAHPEAANPGQLQSLSALVGKTFSVKMTPRGEVLEIAGLDAMLDQVIADFGGGAVAESIRQTLEQQFGEDAVRQNMLGMVATFPENPVALGESWSERLSMGGMFPFTVDCTWTLKGVQSGIATIDLACRIQTEADSRMDVGGVEATVTLAGSQQGTTQVDTATGWTISGQVKQDMAGKIETMGMTIPMTLTSDVRVENVK